MTGVKTEFKESYQENLRNPNLGIQERMKKKYAVVVYFHFFLLSFKNFGST